MPPERCRSLPFGLGFITFLVAVWLFALDDGYRREELLGDIERAASRPLAPGDLRWLSAVVTGPEQSTALLMASVDGACEREVITLALDHSADLSHDALRTIASRAAENSRCTAGVLDLLGSRVQSSGP